MRWLLVVMSTTTMEEPGWTVGFVVPIRHTLRREYTVCVDGEVLLCLDFLFVSEHIRASALDGGFVPRCPVLFSKHSP